MQPDSPERSTGGALQNRRGPETMLALETVIDRMIFTSSCVNSVWHQIRIWNRLRSRFFSPSEAVAVHLVHPSKI
jgi:hypothetical protein